MKKLIFTMAVLACVSCSTTTMPVESDIIRQPDNVPEAFEPEEGVSLDGSNNCKSPMIDPRDGTELKMERSGNGVADYKVPEGKYGLGKREYLRLHCGNGKVAGVVKK